MTVNDLSDIFGLFAQGFTIGALFSGIAFMTGWFINFCLQLIKSA